MSTEKKSALFRRGADAARRVAGCSNLYFCPLCKGAFSQEALASGELTLEHIPPKSVGGRALALTCKPCNNTAGHRVDAALHRRAQVDAFSELLLQGVGEGPFRAVLGIAGERVNVDVTREESGTTVLCIHPHINSPEVLQRITQHLEITSTFGDFTIHSRDRYHRRTAQVGELRAAYLAAFAFFGYRYAFHRRLDPVREQIHRPDERIIHAWTLGLHDSEPRRAIFLVEALHAVVIQLGQTGILLPWLEDPVEEFYGALHSRYSQNEHIRFSGKLLGWPSGLEMWLDLPSSEQSRPA